MKVGIDLSLSLSPVAGRAETDESRRDEGGSQRPQRIICASTSGSEATLKAKNGLWLSRKVLVHQRLDWKVQPVSFVAKTGRCVLVPSITPSGDTEQVLL